MVGNRQGQSTVEYIVLVTAVILVIILFANNNKSGLRKKINDTLINSSEGIKDRSDALQATHEGTTLAEAQAAAAKNIPTLNVNPVRNEFHN